MEQEDINEGTDKPSEMPFNPQSSEKDHSKKDTGSPEGYLNNMELEDSKKGTENPPEVSSNPHSPEKDDRGTPERYLNNMELEDSKKGIENPPDLSSLPQSSEKADSKKDTDPPEGHLYNMEQEDNTKGSENPPEVSSNLLSSEKGDSKKDADPSGGTSKQELSDKHTPLKAKSKIIKKSQSSKFKTKKNEGSRQIRGRKKNMEVEDSKKGTENPPEVSSNPQSSEKDDNKKDTGLPEGYLNNMELEDSKKGTENPPELSSNPQSSGKADSKKDTDPPEGYLYNMEQEDNTKGTENPPEVSSNPPSSEKDDSKKDTNPPDGTSKPELSDKHTPRSLKAKSKIVKKSQSSKTQKNEGSRQIRGRKRNRRNKKAVSNAESFRNANKKQISDDRQQMKTNGEPPLQEAEKNKEKESQNRSTSNKSPVEEQDQAQKNKESKKSSRTRRKKDMRSGTEKSQSREKKTDKLGGVIFMCNAKTKPDCFRYRVMGVSAGKKDAVLNVKPGLKLFLYDFDLKLLYGIYKASSSGGMKLEPRAFSGKFPAQVRFKIASDCYPLPENIFRKAIKENYNGRNKFKTELTVRQVRKLTELFRPVEVHSALPPVRSPRRGIIRDREAPDGVRGSWPHLHRERAAGDPYTNINGNSYDVRYRERDHRIERREEIARERDHRIERREEIARENYRIERQEEIARENYRAYGLQGDRRNVTASHVIPMLEPYESDYERLHSLDPIYRSNVPAHVESLRTDPLYLSESEYQNYFRSTISDHTKDPYHAYRYGASPRARDAYLHPLSREEIPPSSYLVGGRTLIGSGNLQPHREVLPVSSRYSFAGPSFSRR